MKLSYSDSKHAYWFTPDGEDAKARRCKGVSTVAKIPDSTFNLEQWGKRQVALGMALDDTLAERARAHFDEKAELNSIAEDAMYAAKSHQAAARGTAIHRVLERHDLGESIIDSPESRALRAAYDKALDAAGLIVVPQYTERIVIYPNLYIAGRYDRLYKRRRDGKLVVGDVKSGTNAVKYPHSTAVQLALYANAPLMACNIPRQGGKSEVFEAMPEKVDRKWGYVVHAPDPEHVEVVKVDIAGGWDIARKAIFPILDWRNRDDLIVPVGSVDVADLAAPATPEREAWIRERLNGLRLTDTGMDAAAANWPTGVKPRGPWSEGDINAIDAALAIAERMSQAPFSQLDPAHADMNHA